MSKFVYLLLYIAAIKLRLTAFALKPQKAIKASKKAFTNFLLGSIIKSNQTKRTENIMKIAVTHKNGQVFQHFGHTEQFKIYITENDQIVSSFVLDTNGKGHGELATLLSENNVNVLICGGIGGGAQTALTTRGIKFYGGVSGDCDSAVANLVKGTLEYNPNVKCDHHHEEHHSCSSGKC